QYITDHSANTSSPSFIPFNSTSILISFHFKYNPFLLSNINHSTPFPTTLNNILSFSPQFP
ncbi:hypothetical protein, partial [Bacillus altitudinis]|uniref:hypothetical protein n=1 Tax=Bacillus altitudinis TaxID=293387 RepID=UPI001C92FFDF